MTTTDPTTKREIIPALNIPQRLLDEVAGDEAELRALLAPLASALDHALAARPAIRRTRPPTGTP